MTLTRILCIDGGGIRGLIPARVLVEVERRLQVASGDDDARISDHFDLIAGTSTGGILACAYRAPDANGKRPRFRARDAVDLYLGRGDEIFDIPVAHRLRTAGGTLDEKYPAAALDGALDDSFGDLWLEDLLGPTLVTAYDLKRRRTHFFRQHLAAEQEARSFKVRDVCRATSAAPTYFEAANVKSRLGVAYPLVDGGVFANNPAMCAYADARRRLGVAGAKDMAILSLGTGESLRPYAWSEAKDWGLVGWVKPVLDIMMSGVAETVHYQLEQIFDSVEKPKNYLRIQADLAREDPDTTDMDNADPDNMARLVALGAELVADETISERLDEFVALLLSRPSRP